MPGIGERLADEAGSDRLAALDDEAAVGLLAKQPLRDSRDHHGIGDPRDERERGEKYQCGSELSEHLNLPMRA